MYDYFMHMVVCSLYYDSFPKIRFKKTQYTALIVTSGQVNLV